MNLTLKESFLIYIWLNLKVTFKDEVFENYILALIFGEKPFKNLYTPISFHLVKNLAYSFIAPRKLSWALWMGKVPLIFGDVASRSYLL